MDEDYDIVPATVGDRDRIAEFLSQTYFKYEPLNMSEARNPNRTTDASRYLGFLTQNTSLMAITKSGLIIGIAINGENSSEELNRPLQNPSKIQKFIRVFEQKANIWQLTGEDRGMFVRILVVDPIAGGRGIGKALMIQSKELAKAKGYPLMAIICSSYYSAKISQSMGMECVYKLPYSEYKDEDGIPIFIPPPPHKEISIFIEKLNSGN
ncbi:hypothetical protein C0J52_03647 [Blattella germanica]|nr:hypothetical protein C0J52_03647 [Blattella germanica]